MNSRMFSKRVRICPINGLIFNVCFIRPYGHHVFVFIATQDCVIILYWSDWHFWDTTGLLKFNVYTSQLEFLLKFRFRQKGYFLHVTLDFLFFHFTVGHRHLFGFRHTVIHFHSCTVSLWSDMQEFTSFAFRKCVVSVFSAPINYGLHKSL